MSREVKRVQMNFDWPLKKTWWGYLLPPSYVQCEYREEGKHDGCSICYGEGYVDGGMKVDPPSGQGYQMWETTSEGSAISPVFETAEELAQWLADTGASTFADMTTSYESWLAMIQGPGWAPSAIIASGEGLMSGVEGIAKLDAAT